MLESVLIQIHNADLCSRWGICIGWVVLSTQVKTKSFLATSLRFRISRTKLLLIAHHNKYHIVWNEMSLQLQKQLVVGLLQQKLSLLFCSSWTFFIALKVLFQPRSRTLRLETQFEPSERCGHRVCCPGQTEQEFFLSVAVIRKKKVHLLNYICSYKMTNTQHKTNHGSFFLFWNK